MRALPVLALAILTLPLRADLSYDLSETQTASPILGMKNKQNLARVMIKGGMVAFRMNDMVQVANSELNLVTLIDFRTKTFATSNIDEVQREDDKGFDSIDAGINSELVSSGQPAVWNGLAVKRDVARTQIKGGQISGEVLVTSDWTDQLPGAAESRQAFAPDDDRHAQEVQAELQSLIFAHPERFADGLKIRKDAKGHDSFQVHMLTEMRLAPDAPLLQAAGPEYANRPILSDEIEVTNLSVEDVDPGVFLVPDGFEQVEFLDLLKQKHLRRHF